MGARLLGDFMLSGVPVGQVGGCFAPSQTPPAGTVALGASGHLPVTPCPILPEISSYSRKMQKPLVPAGAKVVGNEVNEKKKVKEGGKK